MGIDNESLRILRRIRAVTAPWRVFETLSLSLSRRFYSGILARDSSNPRWTKRWQKREAASIPGNDRETERDRKMEVGKR